MGILSSDCKCIPFLSSLIYGNSAFIHTRLQTGQITKWPANAAVSEILESMDWLVIHKLDQCHFKGLEMQNILKKKSHALKECTEKIFKCK